MIYRGLISLNWISITIAFLTGIGLGTFYFGGLWLTVRQLPSSQHPYLLILSSFLLRIGISLIVFYLIIRYNWEGQSLISLLICVLGFLLIRTLAIRRLLSP